MNSLITQIHGMTHIFKSMCSWPFQNPGHFKTAMAISKWPKVSKRQVTYILNVIDITVDSLSHSKHKNLLSNYIVFTSKRSNIQWNKSWNTPHNELHKAEDKIKKKIWVHKRWNNVETRL